MSSATITLQSNVHSRNIMSPIGESDLRKSQDSLQPGHRMAKKQDEEEEEEEVVSGDTGGTSGDIPIEDEAESF